MNTFDKMRPSVKEPYRPQSSSVLVDVLDEFEWLLFGLRHLAVKLDRSGIVMAECDSIIAFIQSARSEVEAVLREDLPKELH